MEEYVTKAVHDEFAKRIENENDRQNQRLKELEVKLGQITELVSTVKVLAVNMENMAKEQAKQGERLEAIESKPSKRLDMIITSVLTALIGGVIGFILSGIL